MGRARGLKGQIPNFLTLLRVVLFVPAVVLVSAPTPALYALPTGDFGLVPSPTVSVGFFAAGIVFLLAVATDFLDGHLARKWRVVSTFGKLWDPVADKILINALLIALAAGGYVHWSIVALLVVRDTAVDGMRMHAAAKGTVVAAGMWGKLKTTFQMAALVATLFVFALPLDAAARTPAGQAWYWAGQMLLYWVALVCSLVSGVLYYCKITKSLRQNAVLAPAKPVLAPVAAPPEGERDARPS